MPLRRHLATNLDLTPPLDRIHARDLRHPSARRNGPRRGASQGAYDWVLAQRSAAHRWGMTALGDAFAFGDAFTAQPGASQRSSFAATASNSIRDASCNSGPADVSAGPLLNDRDRLRAAKLHQGPPEGCPADAGV